MKHLRLFILVLSLLATPPAFSQISRGGVPYFRQPSIVFRTASKPLFIEMPAFNLDSILRDDVANGGIMRGSFKFAHKFFTHIDSNDAIQTVLDDGTTVKQIGIRSAGAYSINLLLRNFEIPPCGKLFVYSADHSHVVGSFDERNNSPERILPIQPVAGESIIIEYSEPVNVPFKGHFTIAEVNHDYRNIFRAEPQPDAVTAFSCMQDALCSDATEETIRSTVLLIINGDEGCTGTLINNTSGDGKPYLLTAVHCFVDDYSKPFPVDKDYYSDKAGTIIAFFNYNRPVCDAKIKMKGSEEMSLAGAYPRAIVARKDIALLELKDTPPDYFNAYYAGWNRDLTGIGRHTNVHHPSFGVKKYGMTDGKILIGSIPKKPTFDYSIFFDNNSHWIIPNWTVGSTYLGSSGSALFDENQLVVGGLTDGDSFCTGTSPNGKPDYFFALGTGWETADSTNQLKTYLDPINKNVMQYPGKDPNLANPVVRLANAQYTGSDQLTASVLNAPNSGFVFGNSNLSNVEFAEEFNIASPLEIFGTYLLMPTMPYSYTSGVTVSVYTGVSSPEKKIYSTAFVPKYLNYTDSTGFYSEQKTISKTPTETFVVFDSPVSITAKKFFISYTVDNSTAAKFCVYNTVKADPSLPNTAWLKDKTNGWISADAYAVQPMKTSLAIQPLVRKADNDSVEKPPVSGDNGFYFDRSRRMLTLKYPLNQSGQITIYSISGQVLEKIQVQQEQTIFVLRPQPKGTICILKISDKDSIHTGKIMY